MEPIDARRGPFRISTDKSLLDVPLVHHWLTTATYWATDRSLDTVRKSIENSLCFGLYESERLVGFARVVTDYATFAWLCDVFVLEEFRGRGLGIWLVETIAAQPVLQTLLFLLATRDAHGLYERHGGFQLLPAPERWMVRPGGIR
jgi:GNAT superfamily N-acetyltransferase